MGKGKLLHLKELTSSSSKTAKTKIHKSMKI